MFKAMALICAAWISNGQAKQACFTHMFDWEFETKREMSDETDLLSGKRITTLSQHCIRRMY